MAVARSSDQLAALAPVTVETGPLIAPALTGRRQAQRLGIALTGTAGVLCAAKARGFIDAVVPILEQMRIAGYFLGPKVVLAARRQAGE